MESFIDMTVLIADDDAGMRLVLRKIIESMDDVVFMGEACDGAEAVKLYEELKPDVIFLDVDMPVMNGMQAAEQIRAAMPDATLVFCTAHSEYMPEAFELYAADYLVKPFKTERVRQTIRRIATSQAQVKTTPARTLMLKNRDGITFLPVNEIILIYREAKLTYIETITGTFTTSESLSELWTKLKGGEFFKSHRAYVINTSFITKMQPYGRWTYVVALKDTKKTALITQEKLDELRELMR